MTRWLCLAAIVLAALPERQLLAQYAPSRAVLTGGVFEYVVRAGDTLTSLTSRFGTSEAVVREMNHLDRQARLAPDQRLLLDNRHIVEIDAASITINVAQRMLFVTTGGTVTGFPVAVGVRGWPTPVGAFTVIEKETNPTWDVPVSIQEEMRQQGRDVITRMPPSPQNPLGAHWIRLSFPSLGIHGTIAPSSVYRYASHGCIRMHPDDVKALFDQVEIGAAGVIRYQPVVMAVIEGRVLLEAHPDGYHRGHEPATYILRRSEELGVASQVDWPAALRVLREQRGLAVDVTTEELAPAPPFLSAPITAPRDARVRARRDTRAPGSAR